MHLFDLSYLTPIITTTWRAARLRVRACPDDPRNPSPPSEDATDECRPDACHHHNANGDGEIRQPGSGFQVIGEPRPLGAGSPIRAMQAVGPAHEVLYLTRVAAGTPPMYSARSFVDRPFVVILGSRDLDETRRFLRERLTLESSSFGPARMTVLNKAFGLDIETTHPLAVARISPEYSLELDQYPPQATERSRRPGELPPAMAIVTFEVESLQPLKTLWLTPPLPIATAPYRGRRAVSIRGSTGELIELVEAGSTLR